MTPHVYPLCEGAGVHAEYNDDDGNCRACHGASIVWGTEEGGTTTIIEKKIEFVPTPYPQPWIPWWQPTYVLPYPHIWCGDSTLPTTRPDPGITAWNTAGAAQPSGWANWVEVRGEVGQTTGPASPYTLTLAAP